MYKQMIQELYAMAEENFTSLDYFENPAIDGAFDSVIDLIPCPGTKAAEWKIAFGAVYNLVALAHADGFKRGAEASQAALGQMLTGQVEETDGAELWAEHYSEVQIKDRQELEKYQRAGRIELPRTRIDTSGRKCS